MTIINIAIQEENLNLTVGETDGRSAYQVAVDNGFVGTEPQWLASLVGADGAPGVNGTNGTNGIDGTDGVGVPVGGTTGQILAKNSNTAYDTSWVNQAASGVSSVTSTSPVTTNNTDPANPVISITEDSTHRFVTDTEKTTWNSKEAGGTMATHVAALDPHTQYALESALGTAAYLNVPATGNASATEVVKGNDTRLVAIDLASPGPIGGTTPSTIGATTGTYSGGTRTTSGSTLTITETLNNAAVAFPGALIVDQADTASASGSLIADFRSGGASKAAIRKDGAVKLSGPSSGYGLILGTAQYREMSLYLGYDLQGGPGIALGNAAASTAYSGLCPNGVTTGSAGRYGWSSASAIAAGWDTAIGRNAAGVVEVNNGTSGDFRDLKLRNLIATGRIDLPQYTTATLPAVVNGAMIFNSDTDKAMIGGVSAWETITSV